MVRIFSYLSSSIAALEMSGLASHCRFHTQVKIIANLCIKWREATLLYIHSKLDLPGSVTIPPRCQQWPVRRREQPSLSVESHSWPLRSQRGALSASPGQS